MIIQGFKPGYTNDTPSPNHKKLIAWDQILIQLLIKNVCNQNASEFFANVVDSSVISFYAVTKPVERHYTYHDRGLSSKPMVVLAL